MSRLAYLPWCQAIADILGGFTADTDELELMWEANISPVEAAAVIAIAQFEKEINR